MNPLKSLRRYLDNNPKLKPYLLMWLRKTTKTINKWPEDKFINGVMECYERHTGYTFDLNNPVLFNEKLQWYKVFYKRDDFANITDKVLFKEYIKNHLGDGYTVPMYGSWSNIDELQKDWDSLPSKFVLKSNLQANSSAVMIISDKSNTDFKEIRSKLKSWLKPWNTLLNSWDYRFYNSTPQILAEEFMQDESGELRDYKFFCFNGHVPYFRVDYGRSNKHHACFFNEEYKELDISVPDFPKEDGVKIDLPDTIAEMHKLARQLSEGFPFIRIDFFSCNNKIYLSEFTFAPGGGVTHYPDMFNKELGELFHLPKQ